eukprot:TRINITY_DN9420_c0_g1_i3.p1 TRINITY_DN9420_c0_g1~~TRINITY_DN9420_c0_g1_i3.p1  ORF type:complete len:378 (-),score=12.25 TRINITY_DN9420_c0_g1_i3:611-1624(-)
MDAARRCQAASRRLGYRMRRSSAASIRMEMRIAQRAVDDTMHVIHSAIQLAMEKRQQQQTEDLLHSIMQPSSVARYGVNQEAKTRDVDTQTDRVLHLSTLALAASDKDDTDDNCSVISTKTGSHSSVQTDAAFDDTEWEGMVCLRKDPRPLLGSEHFLAKLAYTRARKARMQSSLAVVPEEVVVPEEDEDHLPAATPLEPAELAVLNISSLKRYEFFHTEKYRLRCRIAAFEEVHICMQNTQLKTYRFLHTADFVRCPCCMGPLKWSGLLQEYNALWSKYEEVVARRGSPACATTDFERQLTKKSLLQNCDGGKALLFLELHRGKAGLSADPCKGGL